MNQSTAHLFIYPNVDNHTLFSSSNHLLIPSVGHSNQSFNQLSFNLTDTWANHTQLNVSTSTTSGLSWSHRLFGFPFNFRLLFVVTPFVLVFFAAVFGNLLVIATLVFDRRMRTVTNAFLLNLAVADLLLGIFCMPFTLLGFIMRQFMFGAFMCKLVSYLQAVSVCVSSWTLVTMSVERYYAICQPFRSKSERQTWSHVYKMIGVLWAVSLMLMFPIAYLSELQPTREPDKYKCRERWPSEHHLIVFTILLDVLLFLIPLIVMTGAYSRIIVHLRGLVGLAHSHSLQHTIRRTSGSSSFCINSVAKSSPSAHNSAVPNHTMHTTHTTHTIHVLSSSVDTSQSDAGSGVQTKSHSDPEFSAIDNNNDLNELDQNALSAHSNGRLSPAFPTDNHKHVLVSGQTSNESTQPETPNQCKTLQSILHHSHTASKTTKQLHLVSPQSNDVIVFHSDLDRSASIGTNSDMHSSVSHTDSPVNNHNPFAHHTSTANAVQLRSSVDRHLAEKRQSHVLRMLVAVIVEFFVCWTPLHVINLLSLYYPQVVYQAIGYDGLSFLYWLAYLSTCTNPITYCFMNRRFRRSFRSLFTCARFRFKSNLTVNRSNHTVQASSSRL